MVCDSQFRKHYVDQLTEESHFRSTHISVNWSGLDPTGRSICAGKIDLLGMKGDENFFNISVPKEPLPTQQNAEGMSVCLCFHKSVMHDKVSAHDDLLDYSTGFRIAWRLRMTF